MDQSKYCRTRYWPQRNFENSKPSRDQISDRNCRDEARWDSACTHVPGVAATEVLDPTGCGDAFRGALLYGLERGWPLERCVALGNRVGALKIASRGGQNHHIDRSIVAS